MTWPHFEELITSHLLIAGPKVAGNAALQLRIVRIYMIAAAGNLGPKLSTTLAFVSNIH
jgi:hypothetical protein